MRKIDQIRSRKRSFWRSQKVRRRPIIKSVIAAAIRIYRRELQINHPIRAAHLALRNVPWRLRPYVRQPLSAHFHEHELPRNIAL